MQKTGQSNSPNDLGSTYLCPAGKSLYQDGANCTINGRCFTKFSGA